MIDIVPVPELQKNFDVDAFISWDRTEIRVDGYIYDYRINRYRFSLAHEIGHVVLHPKIWENTSLSAIGEWKTAMVSIDPTEYGFLEYHANQFAGLVLVPPEILRQSVERELERLKEKGQSAAQFDVDLLTSSIAVPIATEFEVSRAVIVRRINDDKLL